jgi:hypothetical protein
MSSPGETLFLTCYNSRETKKLSKRPQFWMESFSMHVEVDYILLTLDEMESMKLPKGVINRMHRCLAGH